MDWNWFFSALAQSTAAIVGLIGAFVFTRIVSNESEFNRKNDELDRLRAKAQELAGRPMEVEFSRYVEDVREPALVSLERHFDSLEEDEEAPSSEAYVYHLGFSLFEDIETLLAKVEEKLGDLESGRDENDRIDSGFGFLQLRSVSRMDEQAEAALRSLPEKLDLERFWDRRRRVFEYHGEVESHIESIGRFLSDTEGDPQYMSSMNLVIIVLLSLFLVGVIYPLGKLPSLEGGQILVSFSAIRERILSFQGVVLTIVALLFCWIAVHFHRLNESLTFDPERLTRLRECTKLEMYSPWLANAGRHREWLASNEDEIPPIDGL